MEVKRDPSCRVFEYRLALRHAASNSSAKLLCKVTVHLKGCSMDSLHSRVGLTNPGREPFWFVFVLERPHA